MNIVDASAKKIIMGQSMIYGSVRKNVHAIMALRACPQKLSSTKISTFTATQSYRFPCLLRSEVPLNLSHT